MGVGEAVGRQTRLTSNIRRILAVQSTFKLPHRRMVRRPCFPFSYDKIIPCRVCASKKIIPYRRIFPS